MKKITIFTPTYNRSNTLDRLYESLLNQTDDNFVWLIVDDGSQDDTNKKVLSWKTKAKIEIDYFKQENRGKSYAHNVGVKLTKTELFTCVDSDDYLSENAIEVILKTWLIFEETKTIGIIALKKNSQSNTLPRKLKTVNTTLQNVYLNQKYKGELMLIYKTVILKKYFFPIFDGEKFVPESYLYDLMDKEGVMIPLNEILYYFSYNLDGYTMNMRKTLLENHRGYKLFLENRIKDSSYNELYMNIIRYDSICLATYSQIKYSNKKNLFISYLVRPFSYFFYFKSYRKFENKKGESKC